MKDIKILKNEKILSVIFGFAFAILILNVALAGVSVSPIITDKQKYDLGDIVKIKFNITIVDEVGYCVLDNVTLNISNGNFLFCYLPTLFGNYINYNCGGYNINLTVTQMYHNCYQYGGNNTYYYVIYWQIPYNWSRGVYTIKVDMLSGGKTNTSQTTFIVVTPNISIFISACPILLPVGGGNVTYYYNVTNTGGVKLTNINVSDDKCPFVVCPKTTLNIGESMICNCTTTINETTTNIATVTAWYEQQKASAIANATVNILPPVEPLPPPIIGYCPPPCPPEEIVIGRVTITQQILTTIPDKTTPGRYCFKIECITKTYLDGKLISNITKNVPPTVNITLVLPDGKKITIHTNERGEICYDFVCGVYEIIIPKGICGDEYRKTITITYGRLHITPYNLTKAKVNETLTYTIRDDNGNAVKDAKVNVVLPDKNITRISDTNGKITFNVGEKEGIYKLIAQKDCYENDTLVGRIIMPKLILTCDAQVNVSATLCCYVKDEEGNAVEGANVKLIMPDGKEIILISDANGRICTNKTKTEGDVKAIASKKGYKDSDIVTSKIIKPVIICPPDRCCEIFGVMLLFPCWMFFLLLILIPLLLFFLLRKKKIYVDEDTVDKAIAEGRLENISNKYSKIYVSRKPYERIHEMNIKDKIKSKFEFVDLDEKGKKYLKDCGDEHVARAKQLNVGILTANEERAKKAEENKVKVKRYISA